MTRIALIGFGKIARDAHLPAIAANRAFELVAVADPCGVVPDVAGFDDYRSLLAAPLSIDAVAICTPPAVRHGIAAAALAAGKHVLLEKPPAATPEELADLEQAAARHRRVLFTAWHSRYNAAVEQAKAWLANREVRGLAITWQEDVRKWHPGQDWIWRTGGFGVFDPGINALSVVTHILPAPLHIRSAKLLFEGQAEAPIAARLSFGGGAGRAELHAVFDWRPTETDIRDITVTTVDGHLLHLSRSGGCLILDGEILTCEVRAEYQGVYAHFDALLRHGASCVDGAPLELAAEAFRLGRRVTL